VTEEAERREMLADKISDLEKEIAVRDGIITRMRAGWRVSKFSIEWYRKTRNGPTVTEPMTLDEARTLGKT
jgi:hypothetical protein